MSGTTEMIAQACPSPAVHFVGFRGEEYHSARKVWGRPTFIHMGWDRRAQREILPIDTVVFATGEHDQQPRDRNWPDLREGSET